MFDHCNDDALEVVRRAAEAARTGGSSLIGSEDLLWALSQSEDTSKLLGKAGLTAPRIHSEIFNYYRSLGSPLDSTPPFSRRAKRALEQARRIAQGEIGAEHILAGLTAEQGGVAAHIIGRLGADREQLHRDSLTLLGAGVTA